MPAMRLFLSYLLAISMAVGAGGASATMASPSGSVATLSDPRATERPLAPADPSLGETSHAWSSASDCSASLMALLPVPVHVTGRGCRTLPEVAATFADPEEAARNLTAWGWIETVYLSYGDTSVGATRISIHRFETPEGAAQALDPFGSIDNEPAGTYVVDPKELAPDQRALGGGYAGTYVSIPCCQTPLATTQRNPNEHASGRDTPENSTVQPLSRGAYWGALVEQDATLIIRVAQTTCCWADAPPSPIPDLLAIMDALTTSWTSRDDASGAQLANSSDIVIDPEADTALADTCLEYGELACAKEYFEAAYASAKDARTQAALYEFYLLSGDMWQEHVNLERARQDYALAARLDPAGRIADERIQRLDTYSDVELFDHFYGFTSLRARAPSPNGVLFVEATGPAGASVHWSHTPTSSTYAVAVDLLEAPESTAVGINLAHTPADSGVTFLVDLATREWWIAAQNPDGSWTALFPRESFADLVHGRVTWLEVQIRDGTPAFVVNDTDVTTSVDLSWLRIPQVGDAGIVVVQSQATFSSFGVYDLNMAADALGAMLPNQDDVPANLVLLEEGTREAEEITATFPDPADAAQQFAAWGWQETAYREFASPDGTTSVSLSLHRFADSQSAADALPYLAEARASAMGLDPVPVADIGDQVEALTGEVAGGQEVSLYVQQGAVVARVTVVTSEGEPFEIARETAISILKK